MSQSPDVVSVANTAHAGHPQSEQTYFRWVLALIRNFSVICEGRCVGYDSEQSCSTSCSSRTVTIVYFERDGLWFAEVGGEENLVAVEVFCFFFIPDEIFHRCLSGW